MGDCSWYRTQNEAPEFAWSALDAQRRVSAKNMKKQSRTRRRLADTIRPEYDFSKGVRGKHAARYAAGTNIVVLEPDVAREFPTDYEVNETLRAVAKLLKNRKRPGSKTKPA
jgi:alpha-beta hydrolase superfamily lysophospholipase